MYIEGLIHGNMDKEVRFLRYRYHGGLRCSISPDLCLLQNALALQSMVESVLKPRVLTASEKIGERSMLLPEGERDPCLTSRSMS